jgi:hypothetical protein
MDLVSAFTNMGSNVPVAKNDVVNVAKKFFYRLFPAWAIMMLPKSELNRHRLAIWPRLISRLLQFVCPGCQFSLSAYGQSL